MEILSEAPGNQDRQLAAKFDQPTPVESIRKSVGSAESPKVDGEPIEDSGKTEVVSGPKLESRASDEARPHSMLQFWAIGCLVATGLIVLAGYRWGHRR